MDSDMEKCNEKLTKLVESMDKSLQEYLKGGHINLAAVVGALENFKFYVIDLAKKLQKGEELKWQKIKPASYIG